ncbi:unnamed protein product [Penicillium salamii]|uniref:Uncharacterized protein n=1 Tax=Penicillium salamii TaxID=1612424 RepID=A0A9W4JHS7_9EURO|nr:unnamed protein product [Penicillium salamii]CAG8279614.1 unnamed protein product [Penicillium salamii]CAG8324746.1 unnamed protein product [Penicillium salamii]CAG8387703.1 unnamed protein product [Penicillium salamii]CAG8392999.1 unnamed protein product [Penicillium salamii]
MIRKIFTIVLLSVLTAAAPVPAKTPEIQEIDPWAPNSHPKEEGTAILLRWTEHSPELLAALFGVFMAASAWLVLCRLFHLWCTNKLAPKLQLPSQLLLPLP